MIRPDDSWRARLRRASDAFVGTDPGLTRLFAALEVMTAVLVTVGVVYAFMSVTHVLWVEAPADASPAQLAVTAAQHRGVTLLALILGGLLALMSAFLVLETTPRSQALTMALMPAPMLLTLALSIQLEPHRAVGIVVMTVVIALGTYARRLVPSVGPRALLYGNLLFIGYFFGFLSGGGIQERELGWLAVVMAIAAGVNFALKQVWRVVRAGRFDRLRRGLLAQSRSVAVATLDVWCAATPRRQRRARRRLHRRIASWSAAALTTDALIAEGPDAGRGAAIHEALFTLELAVQNVARFAELLVDATLLPEHRSLVADWLADLSRPAPRRPSPAPLLTADLAPRTAAWLGHLADAVAEQHDAVRTWRCEPPPPEDGQAVAEFQSAVTLIFGNLPGSALAGAAAATPRDTGPNGPRLDGPARVAIRVAAAVGAASVLGSLLSERRFYWAVIAVFIAFMGAETSAEQIRKAGHRVIGSIVGILLGSVIAHAIGTSTWSLAAIVVSLGVGVYFMTVSYAVMVVGVTVMVSLLYEQLGELTDSLLLLRVEETAIGAALAMIAAVAIFSVDTRRAALIAAERVLESLAHLLAEAGRALAGGAAGSGSLTAASRALDHEAQQLATTARPLALDPRRREPIWDELRLFGETAHHARNLVAQVAQLVASGATVGDDVLMVLEREAEIVRAMRQALEAGMAPEPTTELAQPIAAMHQRLIDERWTVDDPQRRLARHLGRLDDAIAQIAVRLRDRRDDTPPLPPVEATSGRGHADLVARKGKH